MFSYEKKSYWLYFNHLCQNFWQYASALGAFFNDLHEFWIIYNFLMKLLTVSKILTPPSSHNPLVSPLPYSPHTLHPFLGLLPTHLISHPLQSPLTQDLDSSGGGVGAALLVRGCAGIGAGVPCLLHPCHHQGTVLMHRLSRRHRECPALWWWSGQAMTSWVR